jgi:hypothetical protein
MTTLIEKARNGRMNALAGLPAGTFGPGAASRLRSSHRHEKVTFISSRARSSADAFSA